MKLSQSQKWCLLLFLSVTSFALCIKKAVSMQLPPPSETIKKDSDSQILEKISEEKKKTYTSIEDLARDPDITPEEITLIGKILGLDDALINQFIEKLQMLCSEEAKKTITKLNELISEYDVMIGTTPCESIKAIQANWPHVTKRQKGQLRHFLENKGFNIEHLKVYFSPEKIKSYTSLDAPLKRDMKFALGVLENL